MSEEEKIVLKTPSTTSYKTCGKRALLLKQHRLCFNISRVCLWSLILPVIAKTQVWEANEVFTGAFPLVSRRVDCALVSIGLAPSL